ncbi:Double-strand break repair protein [Yarrowia sp. C11]|nr:Double-strand break repair protein [Yarrowia sp. E02]KAG5372740.1 Double-strand break repair protein [Yarrowia sp. C11]
MTTRGPDTIRILIATDNHVGYNEQDPIRGDDSWKTFHEIMGLARTEDVDMVLQAGDLFHINKPSRKSMYQVIRSLRMNCYGERPCEMELLSDPTLALDQTFNHLNYEDPNINVSVPVFAISGNHDDSGGDAMLCPNDVLAATGLINHFGRVTQNDQITVTPLLFRKGSTNLALYGLANVRDERLFRTFASGNVEFLRPQDDQEWFSLLAVHQNRASHTETSYLPGHFLPQFLNMVVWGHEHECIDVPEENPEKGFHVLQAGSSVATSLCEGEAKPKYAFILCVTGTSYELEKIRLKTVRPFVMKEVALSNSGIAPGRNAWNEISKYLGAEIDGMIEKANAEWLAEHGYTEEDIEAGAGVAPPLPLIRLRVEYSGGYEVENPRRFSNRYVGRVANINDVVQFYKKKTRDTSGAASTKRELEKAAARTADRQVLDNLKVQTLVEEILGKESLCLLPENGLGEAVASFVDKNDKNAVKAFVDGSLKFQVAELLKINDLDEESLLTHMGTAKSKGREAVRAGSLLSVREDAPDKRAHSTMSSDDDFEPAPTTATRGRGRGRGGTTRGTTRGRGRGARGGATATRASTRKPAISKATIIDSDNEVSDSQSDHAVPDDNSSDISLVIDSDEEEEVMPVRRSTRRAAVLEDEAPKTSTRSTRAAPKATPKATPKPTSRASKPASAAKPAAKPTSSTKNDTISLLDDDDGFD